MTRLFAGTPFDRPPRCDRCDRLEEDCECPPETKPTVPADRQSAKIFVEKRKRGKTVSVVRGLSADESDLSALLTRLKSECGAGGTLKDEDLEIQGDHRDRIRDVLKSLGYRIRS